MWTAMRGANGSAVYPPPRRTHFFASLFARGRVISGRRPRRTHLLCVTFCPPTCYKRPPAPANTFLRVTFCPRTRYKLPPALANTVCSPDPNPQVLPQQVMCRLGKKKHTTVKKSIKVAHSSDKECNRILQNEDLYYTKIKALKYLGPLRTSWSTKGYWRSCPPPQSR